LSVALAESDPAGGLDAAERLLAVAPDELRGMLLASHHCDHLDRKDDAERYARKAVAFRPAAAIAHGRLAETLTGRGGRRREALAAAKQAIELDPADADYYVAAGNVELTFGRSAAAERWYEQALQLEPGNLTAINNMSRAKRVRGRLGSAVVHVDSLLQQDPTDSSARYALDEIIHTTVTHLLWLVIAANLVALWLRAAY
jgi:Flp pilus assembly protein TadD